MRPGKSAFLYEVAFVSALDMNRFSLNSALNPIGAPIAVHGCE
jgi:hypothetical protein